MRNPTPFAILVLAASLSASASPAPGPIDAEPTVLETVVVSGEQPGPGLWQVRAANGNTLWVLATVQPLPKRMQWTAREVEATVAAAQAVLLPPRLDVDVEGGLMRRLFLLPAALRARNNPERDQLADVLPAALYARWQTLKQRYLGNDRGIEKRRPIVAAQQLMDAALDAEDLSWRNEAARRVERTARRHKVARITPTLKVPIAEPKALLKELSRVGLDDIACLERTLDRLEFDLETMKLRANAWALGEIAILRSLHTTDTFRACVDALLANELARRHGFSDLEARMQVTWLEAAETALGAHANSVAVLPLSLVVADDGYVASLAARGYTVEPPAPDRDDDPR